MTSAAIPSFVHEKAKCRDERLDLETFVISNMDQLDAVLSRVGTTQIEGFKLNGINATTAEFLLHRTDLSVRHLVLLDKDGGISEEQLQHLIALWKIEKISGKRIFSPSTIAMCHPATESRSVKISYRPDSSEDGSSKIKIKSLSSNLPTMVALILEHPTISSIKLTDTPVEDPALIESIFSRKETYRVTFKGCCFDTTMGQTIIDQFRTASHVKELVISKLDSKSVAILSTYIESRGLADLMTLNPKRNKIVLSRS
ncbi:MAG: hypothetical protein HY860_05810 [Chlamydiales bacterium]|nr:hypothetical protein [Chlamydiales bacterium]